MLNDLARLYGIHLAYYNTSGQLLQASPEALLAVLRSLGAPVSTIDSAPSALRERRQALCQRTLEPVKVAWQGEPFNIELRLPATTPATVQGRLTLENGPELRYDWRVADLPTLSTADVEGVTYLAKAISFKDRLPSGYHRLTVETNGKAAEATIISAPVTAYSSTDATGQPDWGVFLPLYALRTEHGWGSGDYTALRELADWVGELGGRVTQSLPLLPVFLEDRVLEPSPYLPVSRQLWNEFYIDINGLPEFELCPAAREALGSAQLQDGIRSLEARPNVDYLPVMKLKHAILQELASCLFTAGGPRLAELNSFVETHPVVEEYARFRAAMEKLGVTWRDWPASPRDGHLAQQDYEQSPFHYYLYAQWLAHGQLQAVSRHARDKDRVLYLDLPLGIHPDGFDAWRHRGLFLPGLTVGAPPDPAFIKGQDWAFPPLDPERSREQGHRHVRDYIRHHLAHCNMLRIDHVMGLHRLFVIPEGMESACGVYLSYPAEELYAILTLESQRNRAVLVGEDLGTVPPEVRPAMTRHGLQRMYVLHFELDASTGALRTPERDSVASVNTHDMPPFAAFWDGLDIEEWLRLGIIDEQEAGALRLGRGSLKELLLKYLHGQGTDDAGDASSALRGCLAVLAATRARTVIVSLEDLWGETEPQNIPGTYRGYPNWQRKARYSLEAFRHMPQVLSQLSMVNDIRRRR